MSHKVITQPKGTTLHSYEPGGKPAENPLSEEMANSICREANAKAEKLDIQARYEVVPK